MDESGQDTKGELFLVAVVVTSEQRDALVAEAGQIEARTGKGIKKWRKAVFARKIEYLRAVLSSPLFRDSLFFANYEDTRAYLDLTILTTARALLQKAGDSPYKATVIVDGLRACKGCKSGKIAYSL